MQVLGCKGSVVIVPENAPKNKVDKMTGETYGLGPGSAPCQVVKVPYERWWRVVESGDPTQELQKAVDDKILALADSTFNEVLYRKFYSIPTEPPILKQTLLRGHP